LTSQDRVHLFKRMITVQNSLKCLSILILSLIVIFSFFYILLLTDHPDFLEGYFEVISAFGTVGLSLGLTEYLSNAGKIGIMVLMLVGRVGPLTVAFALSKPKPKQNYAYPEEQMLIA